MNLQELYRRRQELLGEISEIDRRETAANRNYLENDEYRTRMTEVERLNNDITVAESVEADRVRRRQMEDDGTRSRRPEGIEGGGQQQQQQQHAVPFRSLGEQVQAAIRSSMPGGASDPRLAEVRATGMSEGVGADGGFLVQTDFTQSIWQRTYQTGQVLSRVRRIPIGANSNAIKHPYLKETARTAGNRYGGIRTYRKAEAGTVTATKPAFGEFKLELETGMALVYLTDELIADAAQLDGYLRMMLPEAINFHMEDELFNGNGVGKCLGILNAPCLVSVAKQSGQTAATVVPQNVAKMRARQFVGSRANSVWHINQDVEPSLHTMVLTDGVNTGVPVYLPANGLSGSPFDTLYGRPVIPVEHCATLGTQGDIVLADWSQYILIEKGGIDVASSIHVQFIYGEQVLRFTWRNNGAPGYGWSDGALTPAKGTNTQSPFITLDTRA